ncbi:NAD(P)/FAD-dependent oxidoreductase [Phenylobacterium sp. J367]|uniref:NAD(P)/FAD-dependent oxidoreductase n=1 Tax=Phenylobacterium sp. J367 TaxID=2898435 RepID=UPI002150CB9A|nr:FAD-dependent oxidoreductase [Phenylobacterium sp. J367]MCR5879870.1 FAD-dependent oxidoreductase [Phenylobacterium sp. J367]
MDRVVIVGAGHAGGTAAALLRQLKFSGEVVLLGDEPEAPYQRPALSKAWLHGKADADSLSLRPLTFYAECGIDFRPSARVQAINRETRTITCADGGSLAYERLVLATGARARRLRAPGADLLGLLSLRSMADAEGLKQAISPGTRVAVIGGGYIGLEVAASARALGADVTVFEREDRLLARVACPLVSHFLRAQHTSRGVAFEFGCSVVALVGAAGRVGGLELADGRSMPCDVVVVGVGATPNDELASACGLDTDDGVIVDLDARTSDPDIFAIGDVTRRPMPIYDRRFRLESVPNALEQAKQATAAILGSSRPAEECPWQRSDQYDLKIQIAGYNFDADEAIVRGLPETKSFAVFHLKSGVVRCVEAVNAAPEFMIGKRLILRGERVDPSKLADPTVSMKHVLLSQAEPARTAVQDRSA